MDLVVEKDTSHRTKIKISPIDRPLETMDI